MNRVKTLGQGGFGIVSLYQTTNGQQYAVKQMIYDWDNTHYERFKREVEIMANLIHKNIVKILNFNILNKNPWYAMPYYKDGSLRDKLLDMQSKGQVYSLKGGSAIIYYLADALRHAHKQGAIHRDLKPENILFDGKEPIIADWGIGKFIHKQSKVLTHAGIGTKLYCAPEQWEKGVSDQRSDIFSLGVIYRELITGSLTGRITDRNVNNIIDRMTMTSPDDRYQTMDELMRDIKSLNIISQDPMHDFWTGLVVAGAAIAIIVILSKLLGD